MCSCLPGGSSGDAACHAGCVRISLGTIGGRKEKEDEVISRIAVKEGSYDLVHESGRGGLSMCGTVYMVDDGDGGDMVVKVLYTRNDPEMTREINDSVEWV